MDKEVLKTTFKITILLFSFIAFLIYLLYCYAFYDEYQKELFLSKVNENNYNYIYKNMAGKDKLTEDSFMKTINLMTDHRELKNIYYLYYRNSGIMSLEEFIKIYYYDTIKVNSSDISYSSNGKTGLFSRKAIYYNQITVVNNNGYRTTFGVVRNIKFNVESNSVLKIDNQEVKCNEEVCNLSKVFGGLHEISYISNGYEYYGLINIYKDNQEVNVTNLEHLVRMDIVSDNDISVGGNTIINELKVGKYTLDKCYLESGCPTKKKTYLLLKEDNSCEYYTYISLDKAGDLYYGTYEIKDGFLIMKFNEHTYQVFDYDTKESTDITAEVDMIIQYKIEEYNVIINDSYKFKFSE